jgi:hypothetical protein
VIHAQIREHPRTAWVPPNETFAHRAPQTVTSDEDYFRRRAAQELEAARATSCDKARKAHEEMAQAYRSLCRSPESGSDDVPTVEPGMLFRSSSA